MIVSSHFRAEEFVPKYFWKKFGEKCIWWISPEIISMGEFIRERYGKPVKINDWIFGGKLEYRGFRPATSTVGAEYSQHKLSRAIDFNVRGMTTKEVYDDIVKNWQKDWPFTTMEDIRDTPGWTHIDCRNTKSDKLLIVRV